MHSIPNRYFPVRATIRAIRVALAFGACVAGPMSGWANSDVTIKGGLNKAGKYSGKNPKVFTPTKAVSVAGVGGIKTHLNYGRSVTVTTASVHAGNGDLSLMADLAKTTKKVATIELQAERDLHLNRAVRATKAPLSVTLKAGRTITLNAPIETLGGDLAISTGESFVPSQGLTAGAGKILLQSGSVESVLAQTLTASTVEVASAAALRLRGSVAGSLAVAGTLSAGTHGAGDLQVTGALTLLPGSTTAVNLGSVVKFGKITVKGAATLGGTLRLDCVDGFEDLIMPGNSFNILSGASLTGTFDGLPDGARVFLPDGLGSLRVTYSATTVTLNDWQPIITDLLWDPGTVDAGTNVHTNARVRGKRHYFRVHTEVTDIGAWRTRLTPDVEGEADLYMRRGSLPSTVVSDYRSNRSGADGFVLHKDQFSAGQEWILLVQAEPAKAWTIFSGRAFVQDLGVLPWTDLNESGTYQIGEPVIAHGSGPQLIYGEGMRFFKATLPAGTPAWSLWLNGSNKSIAVRRAAVPFHSSVALYDRKQNGQMLVVPPYLTGEVGNYFVSVVGTPGEEVNLDSRIQEVSDIPFNSTVENVEVPDAPYRVYRVQVPVEQIAWDVATVALQGNPNVAIRRTLVAAEHYNDAFSEVPGAASDSITVVPSFLTDGAWYITVYGESAYRFRLRNGPPEITPLNFTDTKVNDQPQRVGWRFFGLSDIAVQLGAYGWMLELANQVPGTEIALRRNGVPSRWRNRKDGFEAIHESSVIEYSGKRGFLERPAHQPDVWYVGVYMPTEPLGAFTLTAKPITPPTLAFDGGTRTVVNADAGRWAFVHVNVPPGVHGWDVRVRDVTGAVPAMAIRRELLPEVVGVQPLANLPGWVPSKTLNWPTGNQWKGTVDWTGYTQEASGAAAAPGIVAPMGRPLEPGNYYIGVLNQSLTEASSFTIESRGIGAGQACPITPLAYAGGTHIIENLAPREARYFKTTIPPNTPSWEILLEATAGDVQLVARREVIPDFHVSASHSIYYFAHMGEQTKIKKIGHERYVLLPESGSSLPPGDFYLAVVSDGVNPSGSTIGTETSSAVLQSMGPLAITPLGTASPSGINHPVTLVPGQINAFHFTVPPDAEALELRLLGATGAPVMTVIPGSLLPAPEIPSPHGVYGLDGGIVSTSSTFLITAANPSPGVWSVLVNAPPTSDATAILNIVSIGPVPLPFDGGAVSETNHLPGTWRYFTVHVPPGALGWDLRLRDVVGANPSLMIRRDFVPALINNAPTFIPSGWSPRASLTWPSGYQWLANVRDWTNYATNPDGVAIPARIVAGTERPLEPGTYYAGVYNNTGAPVAFTIESRGVGPGLTYPVADLPYLGGTAEVAELAPREPRYFRVTVPPNSPSWEVVLSPTVGEITLVARYGAIPDFYATQDSSVYSSPNGAEVRMKKLGGERYVLLPDKDQLSIPAGDYYLAVVSEGVNPTGSTVGIATSSAQITSVGPLAIKHLGVPTPEGTREQVDLDPGQIRAYQVTVPPATQSLEVRLEEPEGNPQISLVIGDKLPIPAAFGLNTKYGWNSGVHGVTHNSAITIANPPQGTWSILVRGGQASGTQTFAPSKAVLVVTALTTLPLEYDGGSYTVNNQPPASWRYFTVQVPEGVKGWDVRLRDITGAIPAFLVRRDEVPFVTPNTSPANSPSWTLSTSSAWPTLYQWVGAVDWTSYNNQAGVSGGPPGMVAAMGRPLEPGTYHIGVFNNKTTPTNYTIISRGIGEGRTFEITDFAFAGGAAAITDLPPRDPKYFRVTIPEDTRSWELSLGTTVGDLQLAIRRDYVPDFTAANAGNIYSAAAQLKIRKAGAERYLLLSNTTSDLIPAGDYIVAVISDGVNPDRVANTAGIGPCSGTLTSLGVLPVTDLGSATVAGKSEDLTMVSTQAKAYRFDVPEGTDSLEVRVENTIGFPQMNIAAGTRLLAPAVISTYGGANGGGAGTAVTRLHTFVNPKAGDWSLMMRAMFAGSSAPDLYPDASARIVVRQKPNLPLNFDAQQNANGLSNVDARHAVDDEYHIYKVTPPSTLGGEPVLGWILRTDVFAGAATVRVFKDFANMTAGIERPAGTMVVVPPYLTFDQPVYVLVKAEGNTHYQITSRALTLERPVWAMPEPHNETFGDSGNDAAGNPLPDDRGIDLERGSWHFFAVDVPQNNRGLLRTELQAISGNPDLYIREDGVPTTDHNSAGSGGASLIHRTLTGINTTYGNWVPLNARTESRLRPGRWYIGVRAGSTSNVRYRLIVSTGNVREMALNPATATAQVPNELTSEVLAGNDWRYYRFTVPEAAPENWKLTFTQTIGDVVMRVRDTVPPGQKKLNTTATGEMAEMASDNKNQGPYVSSYSLPGEYTLTTPPLRPGHVYYVGFRSNNSATFGFRSETGGATVAIPPALAFDSGSVNTTIPANSSVLFRVPVPPEATRFKYTSTHTTSVSVRIEQGTLAAQTGTQHFATTIANSSFNAALSRTSWPWQPEQTYYVRFVNNSGSPQDIQFTLNGKTALNEDEDNDGLLDAWEMLHFGNLAQNAVGDQDGDGVSNAVEFADGTLPNDLTSAKYALTVLARNGTATVDPMQAKYDRGTVVSLSSLPSPGYAFVGWVGGPLRLDDYAIKASGTVTIPADGTWTFGLHSGDGARLVVNGVTVITDGAVHEPRPAFGQINLTAGTYPIELVAFERTGGESLELFAAPGSFTSISPEFRLVGDIVNGGLAVETLVDGEATPGFLVRQVAVLTGTIASLTTADSVLTTTASNRLAITGLIGTINFLDHEVYEGFFPDNAHFPLTSGMEDQPLELTIAGTYTMTALHSLPLGVGADAEALSWATGGNAPWLAENDAAGAFDGLDLAGSGPIGDGESSTMQTTLQGPGTLAFRWRVSSATGDSLVVSLNGATQAAISGETLWVQRTVNIPAGTHRVNWTYTKNASGSAGSDRGYVDQVTFAP